MAGAADRSATGGPTWLDGAASDHTDPPQAPHADHPEIYQGSATDWLERCSQCSVNFHGLQRCHLDCGSTSLQLCSVCYNVGKQWLLLCKTRLHGDEREELALALDGITKKVEAAAGRGAVLLEIMDRAT